jgi:peptide deformylase
MAKSLPIKIYPCPVLRQKSQEIKTEELQKSEIKQLVLDMEKTMREKDGVGLAAPQVGVNKRIVAIEIAADNPRYPGHDSVPSLILINPKILRRSWKKVLEEEGCLSLPEIFGLVKRSVKITVTALDRNGKKIKFRATGFFARVVQHEVDHLDGVLFIDKAKEIVRGKEKLKAYSM